MAWGQGNGLGQKPNLTRKGSRGLNTMTPWFLVGNKGLHPHDGPLRVPLVDPYNLFPKRSTLNPMYIWEFPKIGCTSFWGPYDKDPTI